MAESKGKREWNFNNVTNPKTWDEKIGGLWYHYMILRNEQEEPDTRRHYIVLVGNEKVCVRTDFLILLEVINEVSTDSYPTFNRVYQRYLTLNEGSHVERLFKAVQMDEVLPLAIVKQEFKSKKAFHDNYYKKYGIIRGESGRPGVGFTENAIDKGCGVVKEAGK